VSELKAISVWHGGWQSVLDDGRGHSTVVDFPLDDGGMDTGPTALELGVMAFAGCITTFFKLNADERGFSYTAFRAELDAERPEDAPTITSMKGKMEMVTDGEEKEAQQILRQTVEKCPLGLIFHKAGIKLDWTLTVKKPSS